MKNLSSSKKELIIIFFLSIILFILSNLYNLFDLVRIFVTQHESWQLDDMVVISIFLTFALGVFSYRRSMEMKKEVFERTEAEGALLRANNKLTLLSGITRHDINNQLTALTGYLALLEQEPYDPLHAEYYRKALAAAERISAMIQFTKEYEMVGVRAPSWQDVRMLVDAAAGEVPLGQVIVKNDIPSGTSIFADPLIVKVFYNLMDNAVRHGGKITTIRFSVHTSDNNQVIVCEDDGNGIPEEEKERIFERGFGKNTGLGLALSREILTITNIGIRETGTPGKGARFEIVVPRKSTSVEIT